MKGIAKYVLAVVAVLTLGLTMVAAGESGVPNRLASAKVGEWATYRMENGYTQKQTVISREGNGPEDLVVVRVENIYNGTVVNTSELKEAAGLPLMPPQIPDETGVTVEIKKRNVTVKGKTIVATVIEVEREDEDDAEDTEWYLSAEVPVFGIIKHEVDDKTVFELIDFGEK